MKKYNVEITETLARAVAIEAESAQEAEEIARGLWADGTIVVDADDFIDATFAVV